MPFSCSVAGHYGHLAPAARHYAANTLAMGRLSLPLRSFEIASEHNRRARISRARMLVFMATALGSVTKCQRLRAIEGESFGDHSRPQREHRRAVDGDYARMWHAPASRLRSGWHRSGQRQQ
jgi:hypothetical protein